MKYTVAVLQDDIDRGVRGSSFGCPVARAVMRDLPGEDLEVVVGSCRIAVYGKNMDLFYDAVTPPSEVAWFIRAYDYHDGEPEPFKFEIELDIGVE